MQKLTNHFDAFIEKISIWERTKKFTQWMCDFNRETGFLIF